MIVLAARYGKGLTEFVVCVWIRCKSDPRRRINSGSFI